MSVADITCFSRCQPLTSNVREGLATLASFEALGGITGRWVKGIRATAILLLLLANDQSGADVPDTQAEDHLPPRRPQAGRSGRMHWPLRSGMKS